MNDLTPFAAKGNITMSSREIAELCKKQHKHILRDTKHMLEQLNMDEGGYAQIWTDPQNGREYQEYCLPKDLTLTLVAGYRVDLRYIIIKRLEELEQGPKSIADWARVAIAQEEKNTALQIENATLAPKASAFDTFINAEGLFGLQNAARVIGAKPNKFIGWLKQTFLFYQGGALVFYAQYRALGIFELKTTMIDEAARHRVFITPKGIDYLRKRVPDEILIGGAA